MYRQAVGEMFPGVTPDEAEMFRQAVGEMFPGVTPGEDLRIQFIKDRILTNPYDLI